MYWSELRFGKHSDKSLPEVMFKDPDWFFEAIEENYFARKPTLLAESKLIDERARRIKIPNSKGAQFVAEYYIDRQTSKFSHFTIVPSDRPPHEGASYTFNLAVARAGL